MATVTDLTNKRIADSYVQLLHTGEDGGLTTSPLQIYDGDGTGSALKLATTSINMADSHVLKLGTGNDLTLYHDGSNSYVTNAVGALKIATETSGIAVTIGHTTSETTIADNVTVTGNASVGGNLTVTGTSTFNGGTITLGDAASDTIAFGGTITGNLIFEGSTSDAYELTLSPGDPGADVTVTLPVGATDTLVAKTSTDTLTNKTLTTPVIAEIDSGSTITLDATTDIVLDAGGADVFLKDDGSTYGSLTNSSGNLIIKSGTTTAATFSGANVTLAGTVGSGAITSTGAVQGTVVTATTGFAPDAQDGAYLGTSSLQFSDLFLADEAVVAFGDDGDVTLTHVHNTGLLLTDDSGVGTTQLQFGDSGTYIYQKADGHLGLVGDTEIDISATTIDINGAVAFDGALSGITNITLSGTLSDGNYTFDTSGNVSGLGTVASGAITSSGVITGTTIEATGDTSSSDNAAIGYTSAEGLILTGQGSTSDVTLKNDADGTVFTVPTGTDDILFPDSAKGMWGASSDMQLYHDGSNSYITNSQGALKVATESSGIAITLGHGTSEVTVADNLTVTGDLTVSGTTTTVSSSTLTIGDSLIKLAQGYTGSAYDQGIVFTRGDGSNSNTQNMAFIYDESADGFATIKAATEAGTTAGNITVTDYMPLRVGALTADDASTFTSTISAATGSTIGNLTLANGSITDSSGAIDFGNETLATSGVITGGGFTIGSAAILEAELEILDGAAVTTTELNIIDGDTSATGTTLVAADRVVVNDNGTMVQVAMSDFETFMESNLDTLGSVTSLGTLTALTVDDVAINGKVVTMTGSTSDTAVFTVGTNGTLSIVTTDANAAAANFSISADGTVDIDSAGVLTLDSGAAINIEPASGSAILLDGTISIDAGVVTGATSITSTAFVGDITGDVTGTADTATVATTVTITDNESTDEDNAVIFTAGGDVDGGNIGLESDGNLTYNPSTGRLTATQLAGTLQTASQTNITSVGTIGTGTWAATDVAVAHGGTGASSLTANGVLIGNGTSAVAAVDLSTKGHILIGDGSGNPSALSVGSNDYVLTADSGEATGTKWAALSSAAITGTANGSDNRVATYSASTALNGEANLTFDGSTLTVTGDAVVTDDLTLNSDSAVFNMGDGNDFTMTHDGTTGITLAATPISINSTGDLTLDSTTDIVLDAAGGNFEFKDAGTTQLTIDVDGTAGDVDVNLNVDGDDLVFNQYDGTEVIRFTDDGKVGIGTASPLCPDGGLHVATTGTTSYQTIGAGADDFIINGGSTTSAAGMTIRSDYQAGSGNGQWYISFDNKEENFRGGFYYNDAAEEMAIRVRGGNRFYFKTNTGLYPNETDNDSCGKSGNIWEDVWATNTSIQTSDERLKDNITDASLGLGFINRLRPVSYKWKDRTDTYPVDKEGQIVEGEFYGKEKTFKRTHYGLVAQEVEQVLTDIGMTTEQFAPIVISPNNDDDTLEEAIEKEDITYSMRYGEYVSILIKAVQELSAKVEALENA